MSKPRLLIAEDHTLVLEGYQRILEQHFEVIGIAEDGQTLVKLALQLEPDAVLIDISMPMMNGFEAARQVRKDVPKAKLIFVTMHSDREYVEEALRIGASAYVLKRSAVSELAHAIQQALSGKVYVTPLVGDVSGNGTAKDAEKFAVGLSSRERQVLQLVAEGRAGKEVAHVLSISLKTVEFHKRSIMRKVGLHTTAELARYAVRQGLIEA
ncbi:MAG: response regulator transcription factor [Acidobacteria bacterium]|nr:response regulator transcription factor [Acidobacteriota bacterium]